VPVVWRPLRMAGSGGIPLGPAFLRLQPSSFRGLILPGYASKARAVALGSNAQL
jgi:hypothetical protein